MLPWLLRAGGGAQAELQVDPHASPLQDGEALSRWIGSQSFFVRYVVCRENRQQLTQGKDDGFMEE